MLYLMSKNEIVAKFDNDTMQIENENLLPLYFKQHSSLDRWLQKRAIDSHRTNSRLLKKALRLTQKDDVSVALKFNAATITDTYWVKDAGSDLKYEDVKFKENYFDTLALRGDLNAFNQDASRTPELTNTGSFEKCWKLIDGEWWMYKSGTENAYFSELFVCEFSKKMGFATAEYELDGKYIRTKDFTENSKYNHEPISSLVGDDEDYSLNFDVLYGLRPGLAADYLKLIYTDTICYNVDRHTENYGLLRNPDTGEIISLSPNYDNNIALVSNGSLQCPTEKDALIQYYMELLRNNSKAREMFQALNLKPLSRCEIEECVKQIPLEPRYNVVDIIEKRQAIFFDAYKREVLNAKRPLRDQINSAISDADKKSREDNREISSSKEEYDI